MRLLAPVEKESPVKATTAGEGLLVVMLVQPRAAVARERKVLTQQLALAAQAE